MDDLLSTWITKSGGRPHPNREKTDDLLVDITTI